MKIFKLIFVFTLLINTQAFAGLETPGEVDPLLSKVTFIIDNQEFEAEKILEENGVVIEVKDAEMRKPIWKSEPIGEQEKLFIIGMKPASIAVADITGDGEPELIAATYFSPNNGALYVFKYDPDKSTFKPIPFMHDGIERDFMVADIYQKSGYDMVISEQNTFRALGYIYPEDPAEGKAEAFYYYKYKDGAINFMQRDLVPSE